MGYPYSGCYPTFEQVAKAHREFSGRFYDRYEELQALSEKLVAASEDGREDRLDERTRVLGNLPDHELLGIAFGDALASTCGGSDEYFMRDLVSIMEDGLIQDFEQTLRDEDDAIERGELVPAHVVRALVDKVPIAMRYDARQGYKNCWGARIDADGCEPHVGRDEKTVLGEARAEAREAIVEAISSNRELPFGLDGSTLLECTPWDPSNAGIKHVAIQRERRGIDY